MADAVSPEGMRFEAVRAEWLALTRVSPAELAHFVEVKRQADGLVDAGLWTSGPRDMLSVLGRQRDELTHSRIIGWLLVPTNQHGLGREFLNRFVESLWPGERLLLSGPVFVETEVTRSGPDDSNVLREARADIVIRGEDATVVIENKLDAGEQPGQCERLYWAWADRPGDTRWVFLSPSGRAPLTAVSAVSKSAWQTMSYAHLRGILAEAAEAATPMPTIGRSTAVQYLATLARAVGP